MEESPLKIYESQEKESKEREIKEKEIDIMEMLHQKKMYILEKCFDKSGKGLSLE